MKKIIIKTERLCIFPQSMEELRLLHDQEKNHDMKQAYRDMLETMKKLPGHEEWGSNWNINLTSGITIGGICFKGVPDVDGTVEIGYGIDQAYRQKGYAAEAVKGIVEWAFNQSDVHCITAQTVRNHIISQKVLLKNGFVRDGYGEEGPLYKITL